MVVPARGDWRRDHDSCGVNGLEDALEVTLPGNLLDEHRRETLGPQFLVHTEIVYLNCIQISADALAIVGG